MDRQEKFIARLKEEGLYERWCSTGDRAAKFNEDGSIVLFIHFKWDPEDGYHEIHYPPFKELRKHESFRKECISVFYDNDDEFVGKLARWLEDFTDECPLLPENAYFPGNGLETKVIEFKDDLDIPIGDTMSIVDYDADIKCVLVRVGDDGPESYCPVDNFSDYIKKKLGLA